MAAWHFKFLFEAPSFPYLVPIPCSHTLFPYPCSHTRCILYFCCVFTGFYTCSHTLVPIPVPIPLFLYLFLYPLQTGGPQSGTQPYGARRPQGPLGPEWSNPLSPSVINTLWPQSISPLSPSVPSVHQSISHGHSMVLSRSFDSYPQSQQIRATISHIQDASLPTQTSTKGLLNLHHQSTDLWSRFRHVQLLSLLLPYLCINFGSGLLLDGSQTQEECG